MRTPIIDPMQRPHDYPARRLGVSQQRDMDIVDRSIAKRLGNASQALVVPLGPFYINDLSGTATTQATPGFFNTSTALSRDTVEPTMPTDGEVLGGWMLNDDPRTAGTATLKVRVNGTAYDLGDGGCVLDGTNTDSAVVMVTTGRGVPFNAGDLVGPTVTTAAWTPTTANLAIWLVYRLGPV